MRFAEPVRGAAAPEVALERLVAEGEFAVVEESTAPHGDDDEDSARVARKVRARAMSRARATALALVNWKGVFYERYLLDPHVTALEGANGAGKTTVLIAAYVVLLPDMSRLRFTNVGETGATGGDRGLWGRLGELGRPSYSAMELALPNGTSLVAGVTSSARPSPRSR